MSLVLATYGAICVGSILFALVKDKEKDTIQTVENMSKGKMSWYTRKWKDYGCCNGCYRIDSTRL